MLVLVISSLYLDKPMLNFVERIHINLPTSLEGLLQKIGEPEPYVIVCGFVLIFCGIVYVNTGFYFAEIKIPGRALLILLSAMISWVGADLLKAVFARPFPHSGIEPIDGALLFHPLAFSCDGVCFPSERATVATAVGFAFSVTVPAYRPTFVLVAAVVAASGVISGREYLSDVIVGMLAGLITTTYLGKIFSQFSIQFR